MQLQAALDLSFGRLHLAQKLLPAPFDVVFDSGTYPILPDTNVTELAEMAAAYRLR